MNWDITPGLGEKSLHFGREGRVTSIGRGQRQQRIWAWTKETQ